MRARARIIALELSHQVAANLGESTEYWCYFQEVPHSQLLFLEISSGYPEAGMREATRTTAAAAPITGQDVVFPSVPVSHRCIGLLCRSWRKCTEYFYGRKRALSRRDRSTSPIWRADVSLFAKSTAKSGARYGHSCGHGNGPMTWSAGRRLTGYDRLYRGGGEGCKKGRQRGWSSDQEQTDSTGQIPGDEACFRSQFWPWQLLAPWSKCRRWQ